MSPPYNQLTWDDALEHDCRALVRLALREDLGDRGDITTQLIADPGRRGAARVVARQPGVLAGQHTVDVVLREASADASWTPVVADGDLFESGQEIGRLEGAAADLLTCERTILNLLCRLCGVATLTHRYVEAAHGAVAVLDTRKTTPGWRRLEKYAVGCGGGANHRTGLYDAVLIKDNHLALAAEASISPADAVLRARAGAPGLTVEIEVDTLLQLESVLPSTPDVVLLDNMTNDQLRSAVELRDQFAPGVLLEASGGVRLDTISAIARTGVDQVSVGALTHGAVSLDLGLDWDAEPES